TWLTGLETHRLTAPQEEAFLGLVQSLAKSSGLDSETQADWMVHAKALEALGANYKKASTEPERLEALCKWLQTQEGVLVKSTKYVGTDEDWASAQRILVDIVKTLGMKYTAEEGEAAFYGPKIDFVVRDCIGREWQLGTVQLDYNLPKRFELEYIGMDNRPHRPVMIHRAPFGSMERFVGILIEHFAGAFPLWLAPEQARIPPVSEKSG